MYIHAYVAFQALGIKPDEYWDPLNEVFLVTIPSLLGYHYSLNNDLWSSACVVYVHTYVCMWQLALKQGFSEFGPNRFPTGGPCAMASVNIPIAIQIGTRTAFKNNQAYDYLWDESRHIFTCCKTTAAGMPGEILAIMVEESPAGNWYVAVEGQLGPVFEGRRPAFRTQAEFWQPGWHEWQVNQNSLGGPANWDMRDDYRLSAETKVAPAVGTAAISAGMQQLALKF